VVFKDIKIAPLPEGSGAIGEEDVFVE